MLLRKRKSKIIKGDTIEIARIEHAVEPTVAGPVSDGTLLKINRNLDDCFHHTVDRGGRCTANKLARCPYQGGHQKECDMYVNRKIEQERRSTLPPHQRYKMGHS